VIVDHARRSYLQGKALALFGGRPVLVGPVAVELKLSLKEAEALLEGLREEGTIRFLTEDERKFFGLHALTQAYLKAS
jgi:hypothetical protein